MSEAAQLAFQQLGIAVALGLLVGLQREHADSPLAGMRTFALVTLAGALAAWLDRGSAAGGWVIGLGLLAVGGMAAVGIAVRQQQDSSEEPGMTTEAALVLMFLVGGVVVLGERLAAIAVGAGVAVLLQFKPELHGLVDRLGGQDVRAIMTFALITCIVLPVLPNTTYDVVSPLDVLNPFEIWLMVVLMVGISLGGYLTYKFLGSSAGTLLGGVLGGAISSTATTLSYARRAATDPNASGLASLVILIASTVVFARVLVEIAFVAPGNFWQLAPPVLILMAGSAITGLIAWIKLHGRSDRMPEQQNPTELRSAIVFAVLFAGVSMALAAAKKYLGGQGLYAIAALSGLTDMDAITLSAGRMVERGTDAGGITAAQGWKLIVVAAMSNLVFKAGMALAVGSWALFARVSLLFLGPMLTGAALLLWGWLA